MKIKNRLEELVKEQVRQCGFNLIEIKENFQRKVLHLTVVIDKPGGVNVEDCAKASRLIEKALDKENLIKERHFLIVSSPGIK